MCGEDGDLRFERNAVACVRCCERSVRRGSYAAFFANDALERIDMLRSPGDVPGGIPPTSVPHNVIAAAVFTSYTKWTTWVRTYGIAYGAVGISVCSMGVFFTTGVAFAVLTRVWSFSTFPSTNGSASLVDNTTKPYAPPHTLEYATSDLAEGLLGGAFAMFTVLSFVTFIVALCAAGCLYTLANIGRTSREVERAWYRNRGLAPHPVHRGLGGIRVARARTARALLPRHELLDRIAGVGDRGGGFGGGFGAPRAPLEGEVSAVPVAVRADVPAGAGGLARND